MASQEAYAVAAQAGGRPELVTPADVAGMLGSPLSLDDVAALPASIALARDGTPFPQPAGPGPVWIRADVEEWQRARREFWRRRR